MSRVVRHKNTIWSKGQRKTERGRRLEDQNKEQYLFVLPQLLELLSGNVCKVALPHSLSLPTMCVNTLGWHHTTEKLSTSTLFLI